MRTRQLGRVFFLAAIEATAFHPRSVLATKSKGYQSTLLAVGRLGDAGTLNSWSHPHKEGEDEKLRLSIQKPEGLSDMYVQSNVLAPGGNTGWHSHPGQSLVIVTSGTVTDYEGHDIACKPHRYDTGAAFVDPGGDHVHILRNEGAIEAKTIAVQFLPANAARRIDVPDPGNCHF